MAVILQILIAALLLSQAATKYTYNNPEQDPLAGEDPTVGDRPVPEGAWKWDFDV